jgi:Ca2+-binding EF-hand superfamily protein
MNIKVVAVAAVAVGATAVGGIILLTSDSQSTPVVPPVANEASNAADDSYFGDESQFAQADRPDRGEINTPSRSTNGNRSNQGGFAGMLDRMTEFDTDGDGILSEEERQAMREAMRAEMLARFDLDGDGELSREERNAARRARFEDSERGQQLMRQFDLDGNGVLDDEEQAAMDAHQQAEREARRAEQIAQYDLDGDGELSREERQDQREEQRGRWEGVMDDARQEFDRDGDGQLSIEESQEAYDVFQQRREIDRFVSSYDSDGNGIMGSADYSAFLSAYELGDSHADVNRDGEVNSQDLSAYTDMVTRSRNRP